MKTKEQLKEFYESLSGLFEGYIQMSDKKLDNIFSSKQLLPAWKDLHNENNFILEACLFDGDRSITIRQVNDKFAVIDKKLSDFKEEQKTTQIFLAKSNEENVNLKAKITQIWEEKEDENCENIKVLKPTLQLFSGFEIVGDNK
ncbi:TIGR04423 family type III CRISPR-associated protein [Aliarcobacter cryaerophilus]|jgi:CRISPR type III-associated protein (TIGR04423 family)|uniref:TIGR04423 family type III CRISPR-associated protein n=1 Tax=Aliarcobacter cryaerophilus TaxID=28198 RepID=UPI003DA23D3C